MQFFSLDFSKIAADGQSPSNLPAVLSLFLSLVNRVGISKFKEARGGRGEKTLTDKYIDYRLLRSDYRLTQMQQLWRSAYTSRLFQICLLIMTSP